MFKYFHLVRHWIWVAPLVLGAIFVAAGVYTVLRGQDAKNTVHDQIVAEQITTSKDASIPGVLVDSADTADAQANAINGHILALTGGKTYSQLDQYVAADGKATTSDKTLALLGTDGKPVANPLRATVFQGDALRSSLNLAVMGFKISDLVIGIGLFMLAIGGTFIVFIAPAVFYTAEMANRESASREKAQAGKVLPTTG